MSALAVMPLAQLPPAPKGASWIASKEASIRLQESVRNTYRRCPEWERQGLALQLPTIGGGKPRWFVRNDANPALGENPPPQHLPADMSPLRQEQRRELNWRLTMYIAWLKACEAAVRAGQTNEWGTELFLSKLAIDQGVTLSVRTLRRWHRAYRRQGAEGLKDGRWERDDKKLGDDPFLAEVVRNWLSPNNPSVKLAYDLAVQVAGEKGWATCSIRKAQAHVNAAIPPAVALAKRGGTKAFELHAEPYIERDYSALEANEIWVADHHICDVLIRTRTTINRRTGEQKHHHARPWLTAWEDVRSRKIVGYDLYIGDPCADRIIVSFRRAVLAHGVPVGVLFDQGKDFSSFAFFGATKKQRRRMQREGADRQQEGQWIAGIFHNLDVKARQARPYRGQSKPIERWFGTMEDRFGRLWPSYCGNKPENKPEGLQARLDAGKAPTLEEFAAAFAGWVEDGYNASHEHSGDAMDGKTPNQVYAETLITKRTATAEMLESIINIYAKPAKVGQNGVTWNGLKYGRGEPALQMRIGQSVNIQVDPQKVGEVRVFTEQGVFLCIARANKRLAFNATSADLKAAMAEQAHDRKALKDAGPARFRMADDITDRAARMVAERARAARENEIDPPPGPTIRPVRSHFEQQLPAIQRAIKAPVMRVAAGAEGLDLLALANAELDLPTRPVRRNSFSLLTALNDVSTDGPYGGSSDGD